jgi:hypothetical protein
VVNLRKGEDKMKRFISYFLWSLLIISILFLGAEVQSRLRAYSQMHYKMTFYIIFIWLFPIVVGMLIRLPLLITDIINNKKWKADWIKLIAIGLPFLYIASVPLVYLKVPILYPDLVVRIFYNDIMVTKIPGVILGYIILDSLKKK